jgi:hypothetical protein
LLLPAVVFISLPPVVVISPKGQVVALVLLLVLYVGSFRTVAFVPKFTFSGLLISQVPHMSY